MVVPIFVLLFINIFVALGRAQAPGSVFMKALKIECSHDDNLMTNVSCSMKPHPVSGGIVTVDATFAKPAHHIWVQHAVFEKLGKNLYKPNFLKVNIDLCDFYNTIKKTILNRFLVDITKDLKELIHDCPYSGHVLVKDLPLAGGALYLKLFRPIQYRLDYRFYDDRNGTYFYLKFFGVVVKN